MHNAQSNVEQEILKFVNKMYGNPTMTQTLIHQFIQEFQLLSDKISDHTLRKLKEVIPCEYHESIERCLKINYFENFDSNWRCMQQLKKSKYYVAPHQFKIGEISDNQTVKNEVIWTKKPCFGQVISLRSVLKIFLELPHVYRVITNFIDSEFKKNGQGIYTSLVQGTVWRNISEIFQGKIVIPLYLYYDDFEINNPLSTSAGIYKVGGLYCSIASLPPQFASTIENIFLAQLIYNSDYKEFGAERCFAEIKTEFNYLADKGIKINIDDTDYNVYFVLIGVLGDNLALNSLLGFNESFISEYCCRFCQAPKSEAQKSTLENENILRNKSNFETDLLKRCNGVKNPCVFNEIKFFHNTCNWTIDIMHDLYLGICRYDMAKIIKHCISNKYFTLSHLNDRLKFFDYCEADCGNKMSAITESHITNEHIIITAAEMSYLVAYFGILIGDLIPPDDLTWQLYTHLFDIINIVTSPIISNDDIIYLRELIKHHHKLYLETFKGHLTAKFHNLVHYPTIIKVLGPPKFYSCSRFEAFHKISKHHAHIVNCRINILYTLAKKLQLALCDKFIHNKGFKNVIELGKVTTATLQTNNNLKTFESIKINKILYRSSYAFYESNDSENSPVFGIITTILSDCKSVYFSYKKCVTIGLSSHIKGYLLTLPKQNDPDYFIQLDFVRFIKPLKTHLLPNGLYVISQRSLI